MDEDLVRQWVPDQLWEVAAPLVPPVRPRPQGGGTAVIDPRAVFTAIVYVLTTGCAWRHLPPGFGVAVPTAHRRFLAWTRVGFWRRLHTVALDQLGAGGLLDWSQATADAASVRAKRGRADRGKPG